MKFFIHNPEPLSDPPNCYRFHQNAGTPRHTFECYMIYKRIPINFQCSKRILQLSQPHSRHLHKKYQKELRRSCGKTYLSKKVKISSRLDHLAAPIFRHVFAARRNVGSSRNIMDSVKQNLNLQIQRSMYNIYSRLENVQFRNDDRRRKCIKLSGEEYENRLKRIERLSQPRKIQTPELPAITKKEIRPINMEAMIRLSIPRKYKSAEQINYTFPSRPLKGSEYYEKLSQPRKYLEVTSSQNRENEPKLTSMKRINEMAKQLLRLQRKKFMKKDNTKFGFPVSQAALQYQASANIIKLAAAKVYEDPNQNVRKSKKRK